MGRLVTPLIVKSGRKLGDLTVKDYEFTGKKFNYKTPDLIYML